MSVLQPVSSFDELTPSARALGEPMPRRVGRIPELDGIRALAILTVFANHLFANDMTTAAAASLHGISRALFLIAGHGWLGVDLFFVLSGFLITGILLDSRQRQTYFRDFWIRRALRIFPLVIAVVIILTIFFHPPWLFVLMALFFMVDFAGLFGLGSFAMGTLWSLAVEEQFYLIWPLAVFVLPRRTLAIAALAIVAAEPIVRGILDGPIDRPWFRVDGLALGALIAIFVRSTYFSKSNARSLCAAAIVIVGLLAFIGTHQHLSSRECEITEANLIFGCLILSGVAFSGHRLLSVFRSKPARFLADTSFCAYLIHVPLLLFARHLGVGGAWPNAFATATAQAAFALALTFVIAALSRTYFELPLQRLKNRIAPQPKAGGLAAQLRS